MSFPNCDRIFAFVLLHRSIVFGWSWHNVFVDDIYRGLQHNTSKEKRVAPKSKGQEDESDRVDPADHKIHKNKCARKILFQKTEREKGRRTDPEQKS